MPPLHALSRTEGVTRGSVPMFCLRAEDGILKDRRDTWRRQSRQPCPMAQVPGFIWNIDVCNGLLENSPGFRIIKQTKMPQSPFFCSFAEVSSMSWTIPRFYPPSPLLTFDCHVGIQTKCGRITWGMTFTSRTNRNICSRLLIGMKI